DAPLIWRTERALGAAHGRSLQALGSLRDFKLHFLALFQRAEAVAVDGAVVDENFLSILHRNEAVALLRAKPLNRTDSQAPAFLPEGSAAVPWRTLHTGAHIP